jgi:hypothetical protein
MGQGLGDAQIKNLTDRLNNLVDGGGLGGGSKQVSFPRNVVNGALQSRMSDTINLPGPAGRTGQEWRIEISGNGSWPAGNPAVLRVFLSIAGVAPAELTIDAANTDAGAGMNPGTSFSWLAVASLGGRTDPPASPTALACHLSFTAGPTARANGLVAERAYDQASYGIGVTAAIWMIGPNNGPGGAFQAVTHRQVLEQYGG